MRDQAEQLRARMLERSQGRPTRLVTVTSGKGGVGKSNFTLNFALGLIERGQKVVVFDVDLGLANLDVLMGVSARHHLLHLLEPDKSVWDIIEQGPNGLEFIAGGSGFAQVLQLDEAMLNRLFDRLIALQGHADTVLFDTGAGITQESLRFMLAADEVLLVTTPEPTAITDAYAVIKMIHSRQPQTAIRLIVNRVSSYREGKNTADKLAMVARRFLGMEIATLGFVPDDSSVSRAVKEQRPFLLAYPRAEASRGIRELVDAYLGMGPRQPAASGLHGFLAKLKRWI